MSDLLWDIDWHSVFVPKNSLLEMFVRATIMYLVLFGLMRVVLKRQAGMIGMTDVLVVVLLADVVGNGFAAEYTSVVEGTVLAVTILFWTYALERLAYQYPIMERFLNPPTLILIENGKMIRKNMRAELITQDELMAQMREHGIGDISEVKRGCMEADGMISFVKKEA